MPLQLRREDGAKSYVSTIRQWDGMYRASGRAQIDHPATEAEEPVESLTGVKIMTHFPAVLKYMDQNLDWTSALGDAFVNQQPPVAQNLAGARANGSLPRAGTVRPVTTAARPAATATRPAGTATRPAGTATRPAATQPNTRPTLQATDLNRPQPNAGGGAPPAFRANAGGANRAASLRGRGSMGSARRSRFTPAGRGR